MLPGTIFIMGVSGSGKTTIAQLLAKDLGFQFIDADDLHPQRNKDKMHACMPLTDEDRVGWLAAINLAAQQLNIDGPGVVIACSALKNSYRVRLRDGLSAVRFFYLKGSFDQIEQLISKRINHFMPTSLLKSQFETLEEPGEDEPDSFTIPISTIEEELMLIKKLL